jgi:hypothetical protein
MGNTAVVHVRLLDAPHVIVANLPLHTTVEAAGIGALLKCPPSTPAVVVAQYGVFPHGGCSALVHVEAGLAAVVQPAP